MLFFFSPTSPTLSFICLSSSSLLLYSQRHISMPLFFLSRLRIVVSTPTLRLFGTGRGLNAGERRTSISTAIALQFTGLPSPHLQIGLFKRRCASGLRVLRHRRHVFSICVGRRPLRCIPEIAQRALLRQHCHSLSAAVECRCLRFNASDAF